MIAKHYIPVDPLHRFIEKFFYYSGFTPEHIIDRFLPDGNVHLLFDLTDIPKYIYDNHSLKAIQSCKKVWFSGFRTQPITIPSGRESEMLIVNFRKGKAFPFINRPMGHLTNQVVDAELVVKNDILDLRARIREARTILQKFRLLENHLLRHYRSSLMENPCIDYAIAGITAFPHTCSLSDISARAGYSQKHLITLFKDHVGVTPKEFLKIIRFQKAVEEIERQQPVNWTALALDCGFYDQSHFIADFKAFSGFTPTEYVTRRGDLLNYIPVK